MSAPMSALDQARAELRRAAILASLYVVWPRPLGAGQLVRSLPDDVAVTLDDIAPDLHYLTERGVLEVVAERDASRRVDLLRLTAAGVDAHEADPEQPVHVVRALRMLRLVILDTLRDAAAQGASPRLIRVSLTRHADLDTSPKAIDRALAYLVAAGVARADDKTGLHYITAAGDDYLRGAGADIPGLAAPLSL